MKVYIAVSLALFGGVVSAQKLDNDLKISQIQVIGSHNSYKKAIAPKVYEYLLERDKDHSLHQIQYGHIPMVQQLNLGLRNLEIDVYADTEGGKYARPAMLKIIKPENTYDPEGRMLKPGFKMIHIPDIDFQSWYYTLADCLDDLRKWSDAHPGHVPVFITLEPKEGEKNQFGTVPEKFSHEIFDLLDAEIGQHLGKEKIIKPDDVRGSYKTLNDAILHGNWPKLSEARGKFMFILDRADAVRDAYIQGHPSLRGRLIFTNSEAGKPEAAAMILNEPDNPKIPDLVKSGYIIRTRADANTEEARRNDYTRFEKAEKSGAQIITTDYYQPSHLFKSNYRISFEGGTFERANPILQKASR